MRITKTSTNAHVKNLRKGTKDTPLNLEETFNFLVGLLEPVNKHFEVKASNSQHYELWTNHIYRSRGSDARYKKGFMFASVIIFSKFVSFYFYPLYLSQELKDNLSEELKPYRSGETCFHFSKPDALPLTELSKLIEDGLHFYKEQRWVF